MKNIYCSVLIALLATLTICCSKNDDNSYPVYDREIKLNQNDSIITDLGAYPIEGSREISQQARHALKSELRTDVYFYKPETGFTGEDQVEITTYSSTGDNDLYATGVLRITLIVSALED
ncbi:MAG TPA: hypothetical protein ENH91_02420 [Leeuwenhoekiella sp.]|nr:hypothetical protein [Leeuwenhoekiella sp.]